MDTAFAKGRTLCGALACRNHGLTQQGDTVF